MTTTIRIAVQRTIYTQPDNSVSEPAGSIDIEVLGGKNGFKVIFKSNGTKGFKLDGESVLTFGKTTQADIDEYVVRLWSQLSKDMIRSVGGDQNLQNLFHDTFFKSWQAANTKLWRGLFINIFNLEPEERVRYRKNFKYDITVKQNLAMSVDMPDEANSSTKSGEEKRTTPRGPVSEDRKQLSAAIRKVKDMSDLKDMLDAVVALGKSKGDAISDLNKAVWRKTEKPAEVADQVKKEILRWVEGAESRTNPNRFTDEEVKTLLQKWNR